MDKYIVTAATIDGPMFYNVEYDSMTETRDEATLMRYEAAEAVAAWLDTLREGCVTGEDWDNSWHNVRIVKVG